MLALRLTEGLGSAALLGGIARLYGKRDRLPPEFGLTEFGLTRPDNRPALAAPGKQPEKATTYLVTDSLARRRYVTRLDGPKATACDWWDAKANGKNSLCFGCGQSDSGTRERRRT
jgi:hypothetical protein